MLRRLLDRAWPAKIAAKIVLSRLPVGYGLWQRLSLFRHGAMDDPAYAIRVFETHLERSGLKGRSGFTVLELGPGDSLASAVIACAHGAARTVLVDAGRFATRDVGFYRALAEALRQRGLNPPDLSGATTVDAVLARCRAGYMVEGLTSLRALPQGTFDLIFSQAVLEHVPLAEVDAVFREFARLQAPGGIGSHRVDFRDHLANALNNLRFGEGVWEAPFMTRSGFYTNRVRCAAMLEAMTRAGLEPQVLEIDRWPSLPTPRRALARPFRDLPEDELRIRSLDVLLRRAA
ncbi:methyltransferase domain-containing protein [Zavarzinia sp. CC-PAN008]|uniref:methyltransferase domain-containing protein n=1 Tax=Zavarzinia sp. CC-PAN008 TaxID=3243332 RepID=UPI003F7431BD